MKKLLWSVVLVIILANLGSAYKCYECQEEKGKGLDCEASVKNVLQPNCTESFQCIKYIWTTGNSSVIHRGCGSRTKCTELSATATSELKLDFCETCDSALCNSALDARHNSVHSCLAAIFFILISIGIY